MDKIKTISLNINGLNSPRKRSKSFNQLRRLKAEIACLQVTHIKNGQEHLLYNKKLGQVFVASSKVKQ